MNTIATFGIKHLRDALCSNQLDLSAENTEEILSRLKFIGHVQKDEKINVRQVSRQIDGLFTKIYRTVLLESRINSLKFLKDVISRTFEIIEMQIHHGNLVFCKSIILDLLKARQGILNLKYTYNSDTKFCCDMDVMIEQIETKITFLREKYPTLFEEISDKK